MEHVDEELLTLIAVEGRQPDEATDRHLEACLRCREDLDALRRVVHAAHAEGPDTRLVSPPPRVWAGIAETLGHGDMPAEPAAGPSRPRRRAVPTWLAVAAGVALGVGGTGVAVSLIEALDSDETGEAVVATAELDPFGDRGTPGVAEVRSAGEDRVLHIRVDERTAGEGFREVWLLDAETGRLVSLGVLNGTESTFALPDGLELSEYPVVDVSREPFDGDPGHSTDSIARGELDL
jgi:Anti-sigma-K factor rskA